eukprot:TCALIF_13369-PA protein Name:"Similar to K02A2.6 Uncharacterized protein K02A2.6 (Caenorhabditis elegans)" AED:0.28 eAED:0.28 QI:0/0/0/0.5/1/1/2/0/113
MSIRPKIEEKTYPSLRCEKLDDKLLVQVKQGFPTHKEQLDLDLHPFWHIRSALLTLNGVILQGSWVLIPKGLQRVILKDLQVAHPGVERSLSRARECVYWPGMHHEIKAMVQQ